MFMQASQAARRVARSTIILGLICCATRGVWRAEAANGLGRRGMVSTVHSAATDAGLTAFAAGGNAIDAAIAAALTLGVVDGSNSGLGGGCFMLIRLGSGLVVAIDGRETAPLAARRDLFVRGGQADPAASRTGPRAVATPGALAAYQTASTRYGKLPLERLLRVAAEVAERGFTVDTRYFDELAEAAAEMKEFPGTRAIFLKEDGAPLSLGSALIQKDLAATYRSIADKGVAWFYRGPFAEMVENWMKANGGLLTREDFRTYAVRMRDPVMTSYRGYGIIGFPPPSSGGVHVAEILNILERFDLRQWGATSADTVHIIAEAMKLAFADRAVWLGDPDFVRVPPGLITKEYAVQLARRIALDRTTRVPSPATNAVSSGPRQHTTHFATADAQGNWVACTATINTTFGSKVVVPRTGVVLNNEMDDFTAQPGATNFFGLVGGEANAVAPKKRPLSSMSPTIVTYLGQPVFSVGAAGGPTIISQAVLAIVHQIDFGMSLEQALEQPRFHHQWHPDELRVETRLGENVIAELRRRGHNVVPVASIGAAQGISLLPSGELFGAHDPRVQGEARGW